MFILFLLIVFSIYIRRFVPAKGFLCDSSIEALTAFGSSRSIELRNMEDCDIEDIITISSKHEPVVQRKVEDTSSQGIELKDIKAKEYDEVDTSMLYGNMDASDESLADVMRKGGVGK